MSSIGLWWSRCKLVVCGGCGGLWFFLVVCGGCVVCGGF